MRHIVVGLSLAIIAAVGLGCERADRAQNDRGENDRASTTPLPAPQPTTKPSGTATPTPTPTPAPTPTSKSPSPALPERGTISDEDLHRELTAKLEADVDPAAGQLQLVWVKGKWAYWRRVVQPESSLHSRLQLFFYKYYLQRLGEPQAKFVEKHVAGSYSGPDETGTTMAVTDDGTVINLHESFLRRLSRGGAKTGVGKPFDGFVVRIDVDGVLLQTKPKYGNQPDAGCAYRFIPFSGAKFDERLEEKQAVEVAPSGIEYLRRAQPVRYKNEFAWTDGRTIRFVDIKTGKRRSLELKAPADYHASHFHIRMFDDKVIVGALHCFDAATGEMFGERDPNKSERRGMGLFALQDGIGYYFDLTDPRGYQGSRKILTADPRAKTFKLSELASLSHRPVGQDEQGLVLWTGKEWQHLPWVKGK